MQTVGSFGQHFCWTVAFLWLGILLKTNLTNQQKWVCVVQIRTESTLLWVSFCEQTDQMNINRFPDAYGRNFPQ